MALCKGQRGNRPCGGVLYKCQKCYNVGCINSGCNNCQFAKVVCGRCGAPNKQPLG